MEYTEIMNKVIYTEKLFKEGNVWMDAEVVIDRGHWWYHIYLDGTKMLSTDDIGRAIIIFNRYVEESKKL